MTHRQFHQLTESEAADLADYVVHTIVTELRRREVAGADRAETWALADELRRVILYHHRAALARAAGGATRPGGSTNQERADETHRDRRAVPVAARVITDLIDSGRCHPRALVGLSEAALEHGVALSWCAAQLGSDDRPAQLGRPCMRTFIGLCIERDGLRAATGRGDPTCPACAGALTDCRWCMTWLVDGGESP